MAKSSAGKGLEQQWPASTVELWPIDKIQPYANNPRTHPQAQIDLIAVSMRDEGVTMPILVDEDGVIIAGHGRKLAALQNGFVKYPVVIARGWSEEKKRAVRIKDNSTGLMSGWDKELIHAELTSLKISGYEIQLLGFPEVQLRQFGVTLGTESEQDPEGVPEPPKNPIVRRGDRWVLGDHVLLCGDSTSESDVAMCMGKAKPHLMVTDPPWGVEYDATARRSLQSTNSKPAQGVVRNDDRADWGAAWALFSGVTAYVWHAGTMAAIVGQSLESCRFEIRAQIVWAKTRFVVGRGHYHVQHESCYYAVRGSGQWSGSRTQSTLWTIEHRKSETGHSTQKPIECMKRPIENNSRKGDFIYEPFSGSGTTIIASEMTGRRCLAIEIDAGYVQVGIERWEKFTGRKALLDGKTLEQVAQSRRNGKEKSDDNATRDSGESPARRNDGGNGSERQIRKGVHAGRAAAKRVPAGEPPAMARNT